MNEEPRDIRDHLPDNRRALRLAALNENVAALLKHQQSFVTPAGASQQYLADIITSLSLIRDELHDLRTDIQQARTND